MHIKSIAGKTVLASDFPRPSKEEMQREYNYLLAEQLTRNLRMEGLITADEYDKIMAKNRESFSPLVSKISP